MLYHRRVWKMEKLLDYFTIDDEFGGNQDWFTNIVMHIGGCAAATACDSCIYFAKHKGMESLYPYDINHLNKEDYKRFSQIMKYLDIAIFLIRLKIRDCLKVKLVQSIRLIRMM